MAASMLDLFRTLTSFSPARLDLRGAPWEPFVNWAVGQGLGPLAGYNLEYRLGAAGAPDWVRHRLLALHQGTANDNVMRLVHLKRAIDELTGRRIVLLGGASFAESLYPHVAFRPVSEVRLLVPPADVEPLANYLRRAEFKPEPEAVDPAGATRVLNDTRTLLLLHAGVLDGGAEDQALLARAVPMKPFGPSAYRLDAEDALLVAVRLMARTGFQVPVLEFLDLRELLLGAPSMGGVYSRPLDASVVAARARAWALERGLWSALKVVERLWPETAAAVAPLLPDLSFPVRQVLERVVVAPVAEVGRTEGLRGEEVLRSLLAGD